LKMDVFTILTFKKLRVIVPETHINICDPSLPDVFSRMENAHSV